MKPFRWNLLRPEQLGQLTSDVRISPDDEAQVTSCAARVLARTCGAKMVFVGRSLDDVFDFLSGAFEGVDAAPCMVHLNIERIPT